MTTSISNIQVERALKVKLPRILKWDLLRQFPILKGQQKWPKKSTDFLVYKIITL